MHDEQTPNRQQQTAISLNPECLHKINPQPAHRTPLDLLSAIRCTFHMGAGGMRPQAFGIRRPLRSNGQRVVNDTQKLSQIFLQMQILQLLAQQVTREAALRAPTAPK